MSSEETRHFMKRKCLKFILFRFSLFFFDQQPHSHTQKHVPQALLKWLSLLTVYDKYSLLRYDTFNNISLFGGRDRILTSGRISVYRWSTRNSVCFVQTWLSIRATSHHLLATGAVRYDQESLWWRTAWRLSAASVD